MSPTRVSVVIPTRNGAATLPALLDALWQQRTARPIEIIAVDSGSTDGTVEILQRRVHHLLRVAPDEFDHGLTRNIGIDRAGGDLVVLLVQDALPLSDTWITTLTAPVVADPTLAGSFARQVPRPEAGVLTRRALARWAAGRTVASVSRIPDRAHFDELLPDQRLLACTFDNVASCIRRSVWKAHPFPATPIAEDLAWAHDVLLAGHGLAFVPDAVVMHSHDRPARYEYQRTRLLHARLHDLFGLHTIPTVPSLLRAAATSLADHVACEWRSPHRLRRSAALAVAWPFGQSAGARDAITGRRYRPRAGAV